MADATYTRGARGNQAKPEVRVIADVATVAKNSRECYRIRIIEISGQRYADLRIFFETPSGELRPTGKGVAMRIDPLREVVAGLVEAGKRLGRA